MVQCGVYRMDFGPLFYYGSSKDLQTRKRSHFRSLQRGKRAPKKLQQAFDAYGKPRFTVIAECGDEYLARELETLILQTCWGDECLLNHQSKSHQKYNGKGRTVVFNGRKYESFRSAYTAEKPKCQITAFKKHVLAGARNTAELEAALIESAKVNERKRPYPSSELACFWNNRYWPSLMSAHKQSAIDVCISGFQSALEATYSSDLEYWVGKERQVDGFTFHGPKDYYVFTGQAKPKRFWDLPPIKQVRGKISKESLTWKSYKSQIRPVNWSSIKVSSIESSPIKCFWNGRWHKTYRLAHSLSIYRDARPYDRFVVDVQAGCSSDIDLAKHLTEISQKWRHNKLKLEQMELSSKLLA